MNISRISRSIVVAIFMVFIVFFCYFDISAILNKSSDTIIVSNLIKISYAVLLIILVLMYLYIKTKLYKMKVKRKITFIYRYIYLSLVVILITFLMITKTLPDISNLAKFISIIIVLLTAFAIKKIIFNVSKSDTLSVLGMFGFSMIFNVIKDKSIYLDSILITFSIVSIILLMQLIIDELKQRGIKNKKYLILSICLGISMGISCLLGINIIVYILISIVFGFITSNLDNTHLNFPKKIMNSITQQNRERLYKIERININKLIYVIVTYLFLTIVVFYAGKFALSKISNKVDSQVLINIEQNIKNNEISKENIKLNIKNFSGNFVNNTKELVNYSKTYYLILCVYIILVEILAFMLKRRYDTKSTSMKMYLMLIFLSISVFNINIIYFQPIITTFLILIAIVNTTNIYLNRDERVKMLVA